AFDLLDEVEQKLGLRVTPMSFPIGMGYDFKGIYNIWEKKLNLFSGDNKTTISEGVQFDDLSNPELDKAVGKKAADTLREEIELISEVYPDFNRDEYLKGELQPVFFGSALNNFGVKELLEAFIEIAPSPQPKKAEERLVDSKEKKMTGFVFKIHANMDPKHRDRLAFIKIVSGTFKRNSPYLHVRNGKKVKFSSPNAFFAEKKEIVDESFPGDIVGIHDTGNFKIGDTLTEGEDLNFRGIPSFSPEHFRYVNNADPMKSKQLYKGLDQLMDEGVAQLFILEMNGRRVIGTVGALQFEVIQYRLEHEYGAKCKQRYLAKDKQGQLVFLADSAFTIQMTQSKYPSVKLHFTSEFKK
ncbi:MAG: EF-Tu/IF-2/RF-3 family GTPase, partial [Flavobacteriales bacterium]